MSNIRSSESVSEEGAVKAAGSGLDKSNITGINRGDTSVEVTQSQRPYNRKYAKRDLHKIGGDNLNNIIDNATYDGIKQLAKVLNIIDKRKDDITPRPGQIKNDFSLTNTSNGTLDRIISDGTQKGKNNGGFLSKSVEMAKNPLKRYKTDSKVKKIMKEQEKLDAKDNGVQNQQKDQTGTNNISTAHNQKEVPDLEGNIQPSENQALTELNNGKNDYDIPNEYIPPKKDFGSDIKSTDGGEPENRSELEKIFSNNKEHTIEITGLSSSEDFFGSSDNIDDMLKKLVDSEKKNSVNNGNSKEDPAVTPNSSNSAVTSPVKTNDTNDQKPGLAFRIKEFGPETSVSMGTLKQVEELYQTVVGKDIELVAGNTDNTGAETQVKQEDETQVKQEDETQVKQEYAVGTEEDKTNDKRRKSGLRGRFSQKAKAFFNVGPKNEQLQQSSSSEGNSYLNPQVKLHFEIETLQGINVEEYQKRELKRIAEEQLGGGTAKNNISPKNQNSTSGDDKTVVKNQQTSTTSRKSTGDSSTPIFKKKGSSSGGHSNFFFNNSSNGSETQGEQHSNFFFNNSSNGSETQGEQHPNFFFNNGSNGSEESSVANNQHNDISGIQESGQTEQEGLGDANFKAENDLKNMGGNNNDNSPVVTNTTETTSTTYLSHQTVSLTKTTTSPAISAPETDKENQKSSESGVDNNKENQHQPIVKPEVGNSQLVKPINKTTNKGGGFISVAGDAFSRVQYKLVDVRNRTQQKLVNPGPNSNTQKVSPEKKKNEERYGHFFGSFFYSINNQLKTKTPYESKSLKPVQIPGKDSGGAGEKKIVQFETEEESFKKNEDGNSSKTLSTPETDKEKQKSSESGVDNNNASDEESESRKIESVKESGEGSEKFYDADSKTTQDNTSVKDGSDNSGVDSSAAASVKDGEGKDPSVSEKQQDDHNDNDKKSNNIPKNILTTLDDVLEELKDNNVQTSNPKTSEELNNRIVSTNKFIMNFQEDVDNIGNLLTGSQKQKANNFPPEQSKQKRPGRSNTLPMPRRLAWGEKDGFKIMTVTGQKFAASGKGKTNQSELLDPSQQLKAAEKREQELQAQLEEQQIQREQQLQVHLERQLKLEQELQVQLQQQIQREKEFKAQLKELQQRNEQELRVQLEQKDLQYELEKSKLLQELQQKDEILQRNSRQQSKRGPEIVIERQPVRQSRGQSGGQQQYHHTPVQPQSRAAYNIRTKQPQQPREAYTQRTQKRPGYTHQTQNRGAQHQNNYRRQGTGRNATTAQTAAKIIGGSLIVTAAIPVVGGITALIGVCIYSEANKAQQRAAQSPVKKQNMGSAVNQNRTFTQRVNRTGHQRFY